MNPNEWHEPERFIPERFDPESKYFKTPSGEDRNEFSFIPFHFGARKCLGYKFAELIIPSLVINMVHNYDFEFVDKKWYEIDKYPIAVLFNSIKHPLLINIKAVDQDSKLDI